MKREMILNCQRMTSLEIAEVTGKQHNHVMRDIRNMEPAWENACGSKFGLTSRTVIQPNGGTRVVPCYALTKTECLYVATKFNDEARAKLVLRWDELEHAACRRQCAEVCHAAGHRLPMTDRDIMAEAEVIVGRTLNSNNQNAEGCITASVIAAGFGLDAKLLNSFLCDRGVQQWKRGQYRLTPEYEGRGLAQDRLFIYYSKGGKQKERTYLVWTLKGAEMIQNMVRN